MRRDPQQYGYTSSRWKLAMLAESCPWVQLESQAGLSQLLKRLKISYKRAREYVHSPDPDYDTKLNLVELMRLRAQYAPERFTCLYLDELTYYRQPSLALAYEAQGACQPLALRSYRSNTAFRVLASMNAVNGQVSFRQRSHTDTTCFTDFWYQVRQDYPQSEMIYVILDNWPVHFHPDVLAPLQPQHFPFPPRVPPNWPTQPSAKARLDNLPIQLVCLPTYASWLNPIEKLWRWLKQEVLHLHRLSDSWQDLKQRVHEFLSGFSTGSVDLLHYVGLLPY